jgi:PAS domain S-box-containing protein
VPQRTADLAGHLAAIVSSSDDAIISKDLNGNVLSWNAAAERLFGYSAAEAIGRHITLIIPHDRLDEETFVIGQIRAGSSVQHYETIRRRKDGTFVEISLSVSPIHAADGTIVGASKIARDISERKQLERTAQEASRAKDEFLATLSHELRTPLNTVMGYIQMLQTGALPPDQHARALDIVGRNAIALRRLVDDVLDTSRIVTGKMQLELQPLPVGAIIDQAILSIQPAADTKELSIRRDVDPDLVVNADATRLGQVLWNLLANAVKFTPAGGAISVSASAERGHALIVVEDTGIGLSADDVPLIFQRFWQGTRGGGPGSVQGGLGLGLALARHFVELHGGRIGATSPGLGSGTRIQVELPLPRTAPVTSSSSP